MSASSITCSQDSFHSSSQAVTGGAYEDTESSVHARHQTRGSSATQSLAAPNSAFARWCSLSRGRSTSPGPRWTVSPLGASVVQCRAQLAERVAESAIFGVGQVAYAVHIARAEAAMAAVNAQSAIGTVQTLTTSLSAHTEEATAKVVSKMEARVQQIASYSDAQMSQATATLRQQLESELVSVAASADETATKHMHDAEARIRRSVEAELQKNQADTRREVEQTRTAVDDIATRLDQLTTQLNEYRPVQEATVAAQGEKLSSNVETRLQM